MPILASTHGAAFLLFRCGGLCAALPLGEVRETLRPLPITVVEAAPAFVLGMSIIRGLATVVIDGGLLLARDATTAFSAQPGSRFITLRVPERPVALAVDAVVGIKDVSPTALQALPPLAGATDYGPFEQVARLDSDLWMVLRAGRLVPDCADFQSEVSGLRA